MESNSKELLAFKLDIGGNEISATLDKTGKVDCLCETLRIQQLFTEIFLRLYTDDINLNGAIH